VQRGLGPLLRSLEEEATEGLDESLSHLAQAAAKLCNDGSWINETMNQLTFSYILRENLEDLCITIELVGQIAAWLNDLTWMQAIAGDVSTMESLC